MKILGILNVTTDSFSDGGMYLSPAAALAHAHALSAGGADIIDIGAASSNPDSQPVDMATEIARLAGVIPALKQKGLAVSVDSFSSPVQRWALGQGVDYLNDIHGFADATLYPELARSTCKLIVMHAVQAEGKATRVDVPSGEIMDRIMAFFETRLTALEQAGVARDRLILDPGMGFFLGAAPENSLTVLRGLPELKAAFGLPLLVCVSRKSFLRSLADPARMPPGDGTGAASLVAEMFAVAKGADYIRTHAPDALAQGLKIRAALYG